MFSKWTPALEIPAQGNSVFSKVGVDSFLPSRLCSCSIENITEMEKDFFGRKWDVQGKMNEDTVRGLLRKKKKYYRSIQ